MCHGMWFGCDECTFRIQEYRWQQISSGIDCGAEDSSVGESSGIVQDGSKGPKAEVLEGEVIE